MNLQEDLLYKPMFDETGTINPPADSKGILNLSPETRTKITDVGVE